MTRGDDARVADLIGRLGDEKLGGQPKHTPAAQNAQLSDTTNPAEVGTDRLHVLGRLRHV